MINLLLAMAAKDSEISSSEFQEKLAILHNSKNYVAVIKSACFLA